MPSSLSTLWHPTRTAPPPVAVDLRRVMLVGTAVWGGAFVVTLVLALTGEVAWDVVWVSATGAVLGLLGADWARRHPLAPTSPTSPPDEPTDPAPAAG